MHHSNPRCWDKQAHLGNTGLSPNQNQTWPCYPQVVEDKLELLSAQQLEPALLSALVRHMHSRH